MSLIDGVFACVAGDMPFSRRMHAVLSERFPVHRPRPPGVEVGRLLTRWFCPGCGIPLDRELRCSACRLSILDQMFALVERHPHRSV